MGKHLPFHVRVRILKKSQPLPTIKADCTQAWERPEKKRKRKKNKAYQRQELQVEGKHEWDETTVDDGFCGDTGDTVCRWVKYPGLIKSIM